MTEGTPKSKERRQRPAGGYEIALPEGVTAADWGLERVRVQNPGIRSCLGCIRLVEEVLDSNYAILHCSPERLLKIWRQVAEVCRLMRSDLLPTLREPSVIPGLGEARQHAVTAFAGLEEAVAAIERHDLSLRDHPQSEARRLLCVSIGKIHAFLRDTFGEIVATDPRSQHDADYFLSRRFAQEIDESEWLYSSVYELHDLLRGIEKACSARFAETLARIQRERMLPPEPAWEETRKLLETILADLMPKLKEVLSLRGIRVDDMQALEAHASRIAAGSGSSLEVYALGRCVIEQLKGVAGQTLEEREWRVESLVRCHRVVSERLADHVERLHGSLHDLAKHVAGAKSGIEKRRSLMLAKDLVEFRPRGTSPVRRIR